LSWASSESLHFCLPSFPYYFFKVLNQDISQNRDFFSPSRLYHPRMARQTDLQWRRGDSITAMFRVGVGIEIRPNGGCAPQARRRFAQIP
jgi:hypothetical protein